MSTFRARTLRNSLTPHEVILWARLKRLRAVGFHFRRQAPCCGYYLDFVCFSRRLVVELDGSHHFGEDGAEWDRVRDGVLERAGFQVMRFANPRVRMETDDVVLIIREALEARPEVRPSGDEAGAGA